MLRSMVPAAVADLLGAPDAIQGVLAAAGSRATTASGKRPVSVPAGASDSAVAGSRGDAVAAVGCRVRAYQSINAAARVRTRGAVF